MPDTIPRTDRLSPPQTALLKSAFSHYNMVRMREALRYLSPPKLDLFIRIPFLIHLNRPGAEGFVPKPPAAHGIRYFARSGFCREGLRLGMATKQDLAPKPGPRPCVEGLYHIGSLGTFTQSRGSDFDYWVIIDKTGFTDDRYYNFEQKLDHIVRYSRESCGQEVTFFIMDKADIRRDCYARFKSQETLTAPKVFLKEEFYRTFLYIAGRIPIWTVLPPDSGQQAYAGLAAAISAGKDQSARMFIDLGNVTRPDPIDILKGMLWHICKSREDPVKALIKSAMIYAHAYGSPDHRGLLCDRIKAGYARSGIDDYEADPYKMLFDRILSFHENFAPKGLGLVKNAIFFRLCGFPDLRAPEPGSPKRRLLDRYIRQWNLKPAQVKKMLAYATWSESEKQLLDRTIVKRLSRMYRQVSKDMAPDRESLSRTEQRNLKILFNKTRERLNRDKAKVPVCSAYLSRQRFSMMELKNDRFKAWTLNAFLAGTSTPAVLYHAPTCLGLIGWILENRLLDRYRTTLTIQVRQTLFHSGEAPIDPDTLYLALLPVKPLCDDVFETEPVWTKVLILLIAPGLGGDKRITRAEFMVLNSWGELYTDQIALDTTFDLIDRYKQIALKINQYTEGVPRLLFFQLADQRDPDAVFQVKQYLDSRFLSPAALAQKRPLLDKL